ncbi:hypothetical protein J2754_002569 [Halarchaeum solikamskense]|nr:MULTISPECIES: hypothetical protein [Halarchaeum]MBP2252226.1 hypothetical protein [Halarchaeum solikamskense]
MDVGLPAESLDAVATETTRVAVAFECLAPDRPPPVAVAKWAALPLVVVLTDDVLRQPRPIAVEGTERPARRPVQPRRHDGRGGIAVRTRGVYALAFGRVLGQQPLGGLDARRAVDAVLVRGVVVELVAADATRRGLRRVAVVAVVLAGVRVAVVAEVPLRLGVVGLDATALQVRFGSGSP